MNFFNILEKNITGGMMFFSLLSVFVTWWAINLELKAICKNKKLRNIPYYKKRLISKMFLLGAESVLSNITIIFNYVEKISFIICILTGILHLIFYNVVISSIFKIVALIQLIALIVIGLENNAFKHYRSKERK